MLPTMRMWKSTQVVQSELVDDRVLGAPMSSTKRATIAPLSAGEAAAWTTSSRLGLFAARVLGRSVLVVRAGAVDEDVVGSGWTPPVAETNWAVSADTSPKPGRSGRAG